MKKKFIKPNTPNYVMQFYDCIDPIARPNNIEYEDGILSYDFIEGQHRHDNVNEVLGAAQKHIWEYGDTDYLPICRDKYIAYCKARYEPLRQVASLDAVWQIIENGPLTPVKNCHGDMTLDNIVWDTRGQIRFIDPGHPRGLPCREIDESKVLQSLLLNPTWKSWDIKDWDRACWLPIHWALLVTHFIRLLHHQADAAVRSFAYTTIAEISHELDFSGH